MDGGNLLGEICIMAILLRDTLILQCIERGNTIDCLADDPQAGRIYCTLFVEKGITQVDCKQTVSVQSGFNQTRFE